MRICENILDGKLEDIWNVCVGDGDKQRRFDVFSKVFSFVVERFESFVGLEAKAFSE
jgi:hypothetical protein